jgi:hypothetical protein
MRSANNAPGGTRHKPASDQPQPALVVYRYGCPAWYDLPKGAMEQLQLAHELRNRLVAIEHAHEARVAAAWSAHPDLAPLEEHLEAATAKLAEITARAKAERTADRTTRARPATAEALRAARQARNDAKRALREARDAAYEQIKPAIVASRAERSVAVKALYAEFVQTRGLYWAVHNDVRDRFRTARDRVAALRLQGRPAKLSHRRWDGSGTLTVQLQRKQHEPPRTPALLASGEGPWRAVCQLTPWLEPERWAVYNRAGQRQLGRGRLRLRIGASHLEVPVQLHRMLPATADVCLVRVTRIRVAGGHRVYVTVTARVPAPLRRERGPAVAVHLGWRVRADQSLRAAVWASTAPLTPPATVQDIVRVHDGGRWGEIIYPAAWRVETDELAELAARRQVNLNQTRDLLAEWLDEHGPVDIEGPDGPASLTGSDVRRWQAARRLARLAIAWRASPPEGEGGEQIAVALERWRRRDRYWWEVHAHQTAQHAGRRRDAWRRAAAWLASEAGLLVLDDTDLARMARRPSVGTEDDRRDRIARANRAVAAPGELRAALARAASGRGVNVQVRARGGLTRTHYQCGGSNPPDGRYAEQTVVRCERCGRDYDQDRNAAVLLLAASGQQAPGKVTPTPDRS